MNESDLSQTIDNAQSATEELNKLRKEKEKEIFEDDNNSRVKKENDVLTGIIEHIKDKEENVILDIKINDNGEYITREFSLKKPRNPSEYNINNELLRFVYIFGKNRDNPSDINSVVQRKIKIKKKKNIYSLHFPDEVSKYNLLKYKFKNKLISNGIINWDTSVKSIFNDYNSAYYILGAIVGSIGILSAYNILNHISMFIFILSGITSMVIFTSLQGMLLDMNNDKLSIYNYVTSFGIVLMAPLGLLNIIPTTSIGSQSLIIFSSTILQITSVSVLLMISCICFISIPNDIKRIYTKLLNKYRQRKGIEFIK